MQTANSWQNKASEIYVEIHPKIDLDRYYLSRREGGKGLIAAEECAEVASAVLEFYIRDRDIMWIKATRGEQENSVESPNSSPKFCKW